MSKSNMFRVGMTTMCYYSNLAPPPYTPQLDQHCFQIIILVSTDLRLHPSVGIVPRVPSARGAHGANGANGVHGCPLCPEYMGPHALHMHMSGTATNCPRLS